MSSLAIGDNAPEFSVPGDNGSTIDLSSYKGKNVVLYFYPKDDTPGCTKQACGFRDQLEDLQSNDTVVIGVSKDTVAKHDKFKAKHDLNFPLASDEDGKLCEDYGVWVEKNMYGRKYMGIERATFLIDKTGKIKEIWRKVKVKDHIAAVSAAVKAL